VCRLAGRKIVELCEKMPTTREILAYHASVERIRACRGIGAAKYSSVLQCSSRSSPKESSRSLRATKRKASEKVRTPASVPARGSRSYLKERKPEAEPSPEVRFADSSNDPCWNEYAHVPEATTEFNDYLLKHGSSMQRFSSTRARCVDAMSSAGVLLGVQEIQVDYYDASEEMVDSDVEDSDLDVASCASFASTDDEEDCHGESDIDVGTEAHDSDEELESDVKTDWSKYSCDTDMSPPFETESSSSEILKQSKLNAPFEGMNSLIQGEFAWGRFSSRRTKLVTVPELSVLELSPERSDKYFRTYRSPIRKVTSSSNFKVDALKLEDSIRKELGTEEMRLINLPKTSALKIALMDCTPAHQKGLICVPKWLDEAVLSLSAAKLNIRTQQVTQFCELSLVIPSVQSALDIALIDRTPVHHKRLVFVPKWVQPLLLLSASTSMSIITGHVPASCELRLACIAAKSALNIALLDCTPIYRKRLVYVPEWLQPILSLSIPSVCIRIQQTINVSKTRIIPIPETTALQIALENRAPTHQQGIVLISEWPQSTHLPSALDAGIETRQDLVSGETRLVCLPAKSALRTALADCAPIFRNRDVCVPEWTRPIISLIVSDLGLRIQQAKVSSESKLTVTLARTALVVSSSSPRRQEKHLSQHVLVQASSTNTGKRKAPVKPKRSRLVRANISKGSFGHNCWRIIKKLGSIIKSAFRSAIRYAGRWLKKLFKECSQPTVVAHRYLSQGPSSRSTEPGLPSFRCSDASAPSQGHDVPDKAASDKSYDGAAQDTSEQESPEEMPADRNAGPSEDTLQCTIEVDLYDQMADQRVECESLADLELLGHLELFLAQEEANLIASPCRHKLTPKRVSQVDDVELLCSLSQGEMDVSRIEEVPQELDGSTITSVLEQYIAQEEAVRQHIQQNLRRGEASLDDSLAMGLADTTNELLQVFDSFMLQSESPKASPVSGTRRAYSARKSTPNRSHFQQRDYNQSSNALHGKFVEEELLGALDSPTLSGRRIYSGRMSTPDRSDFQQRDSNQSSNALHGKFVEEELLGALDSPPLWVQTRFPFSPVRVGRKCTADYAIPRYFESSDFEEQHQRGIEEASYWTAKCVV